MYVCMYVSYVYIYIYTHTHTHTHTHMQVKEQEEVSTPKKGKKRGPSRGIFSETTKAELRASAGGFFTTMETLYNMAPVKLVRLAVVVWLGYTSRKYAASFSEYCNQLAHGMSNPSLVFKAHLNNGQVHQKKREIY